LTLFDGRLLLCQPRRLEPIMELIASMSEGFDFLQAVLEQDISDEAGGLVR